LKPTVKAPGLDDRRTEEFSAELQERARAWIPSWGLEDGERDFGHALLAVAARFSSEVAERLDRAGEKMRRGFLDWLAVRGKAARPARMPVVFQLAASATDAVLAEAPIRMQVDAGGTSVIFETKKDVRLIPGRLATVIGVDGEADAVYLPPPGLSDLEPLEPLPTQWQLKSFAATGAKTLQVDPETGLKEDMVLEAGDKQYRIEKTDGEIITIDPPLTSDLDQTSAVLRKVTTFAPFDDKTRNRQEHALYLGHEELLDIESAATIAINGGAGLRDGVAWEYWGKTKDKEEEADWRQLTPAEKQDGDALVLIKDQGTIEPRAIDGKNSRWIRGVTKKVESTQQPFQPSGLAIGINAVDCSNKDAYPSPNDTPAVAGEGMANTTPLVLDNAFFPLGREPRQFDAFYLGSEEAFSKAGAEVQLHFDIADPSFESLAALHTGNFGNNFLAGVAGDGHLYLLSFNNANGELSRGDRRPVRPPSPQEDGTKIEAPPLPLDPQPAYRAALWTVGTELRIAVVAADQTVWVWRHIDPAPLTSGWKPLGAVTTIEDLKKITTLVYLIDGQGGLLFALRGGKLYVCDPNLGSPWEEIATKDGNAPVTFETIVAVGVQAPTGDVDLGTRTEGLAGIDSFGSLYAIKLNTVNGKIEGACTGLMNQVRTDIAPAAVRRNDHRLVAVAVDKTALKLRAFLSQPSNLLQQTVADGPLVGTDVVGHSVDVNVLSGVLTFAVSLKDGTQSSSLALWKPFISPLLPPSITFIPSGAGFAGGAPTLLPAHVVVPAMASRVLVAQLHTGNVLTFNAPIGTAVIASTTADQLQLNDVVAIPVSATDHAALPVGASHTRGGETLYPFNVPPVEGTLYVARSGTTTFTGTVQSSAPETLKLHNNDNDTNANTKFLLIATTNSIRVYEVISFDSVGKTVEVDPDVDINLNVNQSNVQYQIVEPTGAQHKPLLLLTAANNNWSVTLLDHTFLLFPGATPVRQRGTAFKVDPNNNDHPELVAIGMHWSYLPPNPVFVVDGTVGDFKPQLGDPTSNPALSWEYANGTGWWKLDLKLDGTLNLKRSGNVRFTVPDDLRPMDWAGRTNHWIRARLVGGDYGREIVTVRTTGTPGNQQQTIERSTAGIAAPSVVKLHIAYRLCDAVRPEFVLAQDSGTMRDQSDANRTRGAVVEAFVPLALTLGRLSGPAATVTPTDHDPSPCACGSEDKSVTTANATSAAARLATGRALFIGLNATPSGAPVNVLLLVASETLHEQFAPMKIEALVADRFVPIVAEDTTRALGENGLLSMSFTFAPTPRELFGFDNLTWLRLTPDSTGGSPKDWKPSLRGAYLNAVWASAAETLTRELLGSSEGAPNLIVRVARPPVLSDSLVLRVKEPLGEEERELLRKDGETRVLNDVEGLSGDWVLWDRVTDPLDEDAEARVYALDESIGEIRFGDGQHGMIPPTGRDSIVAFAYRRTEIGGSEGNDVPGNAVTARTALNLVSPVEGVEAVFAADRAAGGAPPEVGERVVRFGTARLRHRSRAITAADFEDLALESSPDIVQSRCFAGCGHVRLVVVMRGEDPQPDAAEVRELKRLLLASSSSSLSASDALRITGPDVRRLRIELKLHVATLDHAGDVARAVQKRIVELFDTTSRALGVEPDEGEIARALLDTPALESLADVRLREVQSDGTDLPWAVGIKRHELVMLDKDVPVRLEFKTVEVFA